MGQKDGFYIEKKPDRSTVPVYFNISRFQTMNHHTRSRVKIDRKTKLRFTRWASGILIGSLDVEERERR